MLKLWYVLPRSKQAKAYFTTYGTPQCVNNVNCDLFDQFLLYMFHIDINKQEKFYLNSDLVD